MATTERRIDAAITAVISKLDSIPSLKEEQRTALKDFLCGKDVFALLPTGFGKSLIYQMAPLVARELGTKPSPIVIVVSPLDRLIKDQIKEATKLGLNAKQLVDIDAHSDIIHGRCDLVFGSPESWLNEDIWRDMLGSKVYRENLLGIVVDEVHVVYKWGQSQKKKASAFREQFASLHELRSLAQEGIPVLALTASAGHKNRDRVTRILNMKDTTHVFASPNRRNIRMGLTRVHAENFNCLDWVIKEIKDKGLAMSPIIIYCRTKTTVGQLFCYLQRKLGEDAWVDRDPDKKLQNYLIGMYHSDTDKRYQDRVADSFSGEGSCRVAVATTSLGMGVNYPNVSHVVMYGLPSSLENIVQQVGRAGRSGLQSHSILYARKKTEPNTDPEVRQLVDTGFKTCLRKALYGHFENEPSSVEPGHDCCSFCHSVCSCSPEECAEPIPKYELEEKVDKPEKCRVVSEGDKTLIRDALHDYMRRLESETTHVFTPKSICTGFSSELIDAVVEKCTYIFDQSYILSNLPCFRLSHAQEILQLMSEVFGDFDYIPTAEEDASFPEPDINFTGYFDKDDASFWMGIEASSSDSD